MGSNPTAKTTLRCRLGSKPERVAKIWYTFAAMKIYCPQCGETELDEDMGFWCSGCGDGIEESEIICSLMTEFDKLQQRVLSLEQNRS